MNRNVLTIIVLVVIALIAVGAYTQRTSLQSLFGDNLTTTMEVTSPADSTPAPQSIMEEATSGASLEESDIMVNLSEQNDSSQSGTATISEENGKAVVTLSLSGGNFTTPQPAHVHIGACPTPGAVKYPLTNVVSGKSSTTLAVDKKTLLSQLPLAINVHKSAAEVTVYTACGDVSSSTTTP